MKHEVQAVGNIRIRPDAEIWNHYPVFGVVGW